MEKSWFQSKTIQGLVLAGLGGLWGVWVGDTAVSATVVTAGLTWAGVGIRFALK